MSISVEISGQFDNGLELELYAAHQSLGSLRIKTTNPDKFEYEFDVQTDWAEVYLWEYWEYVANEFLIWK